MPEAIRYPRRTFVRHLLRLSARILLPMLAEVEIRGVENFPRQGPLIVVGNHTAAMEVVLMGVYAPWLIEFMGSIDIPHEKSIAAVINTYGIIPVFRGNVTPSSMKTGLEVLKQDGILGIFPEGGIWEPSIRRAQSGVAWLSYHAQAPILPIGFGAMHGAIKKMFSLQRPFLEMNVGEVLPAVQDRSGKPRKNHFQEEANRIMDQVWHLIPRKDRQAEQRIADERFEFTAEAYTQDGRLVPIPATLQLQHGEALSKFTHRKTLITNFIENLHMPEVRPLLSLADQPHAEAILRATLAILDHLEHENPYYFTYRYGQSEGRAMAAGIGELHNLALWAAENQLVLSTFPIRCFKDLVTSQEVVLVRPEEFAKW